MRVIHTEIGIKASPERVWEILTDFPAYPEWNPFIRQIAGDLTDGTKLRIGLAPPGGKTWTLTPTLLEANPRKDLRWLGRLFLPGLFDGEHHFRIERKGKNSVRFIQEEDFRGLLVPLTGSLLERTERGFHQMNTALKQRAETKEIVVEV